LNDLAFGLTAINETLFPGVGSAFVTVNIDAAELILNIL
jgi:hypothetical protein